MAHTALHIDIAKPNESILYKRGYSRFIHQILVSGDILVLNLSFLLAYSLRFRQNPFHGFLDHFTFLIIVCNLAWIVAVYILNIYAASRVSHWEKIIWNIIKAILVHSCVIAIFVLSIKGYYYSRLFLGSFYLVLTILVLLWRTIFVQLTRTFKINFRNVIIVGSNDACVKIYRYFLSNKSNGYVLKAIFGENVSEIEGDTKTDFFTERILYDYLENEEIDEIYCALPLTSVTKIRELMSYAENNLIRFRYVPDFRALLYKKVDIEFYDTSPVLSIRQEPLENVGKRFMKRVFDIGFSFFALFVLAPTLFPVVALLIKLTSKGPIFFKQKRSGRNNEVFDCYKFRTMTVNELSDLAQATKVDTRITKVGKFLRKTNVDELPQFFNVLKGEMSIVGPRPHMLKHTEEYKETIDKYMMRHFVKPGITGWAQVNGFRGLTETPQKMIKRIRYDVWYIENWSFLLDIKIIVMTVLNMLKGEKNAF